MKQLHRSDNKIRVVDLATNLMTGGQDKQETTAQWYFRFFEINSVPHIFKMKSSYLDSIPILHDWYFWKIPDRVLNVSKKLRAERLLSHVSSTISNGKLRLILNQNEFSKKDTNNLADASGCKWNKSTHNKQYHHH